MFFRRGEPPRAALPRWASFPVDNLMLTKDKVGHLRRSVRNFIDTRSM
jgi:hypothetical protein